VRLSQPQPELFEEIFHFLTEVAIPRHGLAPTLLIDGSGLSITPRLGALLHLADVEVEVAHWRLNTEKIRIVSSSVEVLLSLAWVAAGAPRR
jgi:hypothetical protein